MTVIPQSGHFKWVTDRLLFRLHLLVGQRRQSLRRAICSRRVAGVGLLHDKAGPACVNTRPLAPGQVGLARTRGKGIPPSAPPMRGRLTDGNRDHQAAHEGLPGPR
jgi:hypothetical protein